MCRFYGDERGVLRGGQEQRAGDVPAVPGAVRQQGRAHLLGRVPPVGGGQHHRRPAILPRGVAQRRVPDGHQHASLHLILHISMHREGGKKWGFVHSVAVRFFTVQERISVIFYEAYFGISAVDN